MCSANQPSLDTRGVWSLQRATGNFSERSASDWQALEDEKFGAEFEFTYGQEYCIGDVEFSEEGPWKHQLEMSETGESYIEDGVACTENEDVWRRAMNLQVSVSGTLPEDPADWPRNVQIANEALSG